MKSTWGHLHRGNSCVVHNVSCSSHFTPKSPTLSFRSAMNSGEVWGFVSDRSPRAVEQQVILAVKLFPGAAPSAHLALPPANKRKQKIKIASKMGRCIC